MKKIIEWNDKYLTGIKIIDFQHIKIFQAVNCLNCACENMKPKENILRLIDYLDYYATTHFDTEEKYMLENGYENFEYHKKRHEEFRLIYYKIKDNYFYQKNEPVYVLAIHLTQTLVEWLDYHMVNEDRDLTEFLRGKVE